MRVSIILSILNLCALAGNAEEVSMVPQTNQIPPSSNILDVIRETRDASKWDAPTNGVELGVGLWGATPFTVQTFLMTTNAHGYFGPAPAPHGYRLDLLLQDSDGKIVKRAKFGDKLCKPVNSNMKRTMHIEMFRGSYGLGPNMPRKYDDAFNLLDCFNVENPGTYTLFVKGAALYWRKMPPPAEAIPINIPPTSVQVMITQNDLDNHSTSKENVQQ